MTDPAQRSDRVMTLADEALKIPPGRRDSFLQTACANDPELHREVSEVVTWEERMHGFLSSPLIDLIDLHVFFEGQVVDDRFEIRRFVGDGGMGEVYEAFDRVRRQTVAIKCAKPGFSHLLTPELECALKVRHRNICVVNDIRTTDTEFGKLAFLTMEFLAGETLSSKLARDKLSEVEAQDIAYQLCDGVAGAHHSSILHRDLKPGNVILCSKDGSTRAVITDFGLATESAVPSEVDGGTQSYMAPELRNGGKASRASDVFSLGIILYEMVTGQPPFKDTKTIHPPIPPSKLVKGLSRKWDRAILPCLRQNPEERCSAEAVQAALVHKHPFFRVAAAIAACLFIALAVAPRIIEWMKKPPKQLAILTDDLAEQHLQNKLDDMAKRIKDMQKGKATVSVIPFSQVRSKGVITPQQAKELLHATHVLQLKLNREVGGWTAEGAIIELDNMVQIRDYSGHFTDKTLGDLPAGLASSIAWTLEIPRSPNPETLAPAASAAYKNGIHYIRREPHQLEDVGAAMSEFQVAARLDPHSPLPLAGLVEAYAREYKITKKEAARSNAQSWLSKAEALDADSSHVRLASGLLHIIEGNYSKALNDYKRVKQTDPGNPEAWLNSGLCHELQEDETAAKEDYGKAISADPKYSKPYEYLATLYYRQGNYAEAEKLYKKAIEQAPDSEDLYGSLAGVYTAESNYAEAEKVYKASLQRTKTALTLNNLGAMLMFQGQLPKAMNYYQQAVEKDPGGLIYWLNLGDAQRQLKHPVKAEASYWQGLHLAKIQVAKNSSDASARAYLAYFYARVRLRDRAEFEIEQALNTSERKDEQVKLCAVHVYEVLGKREKALENARGVTAQTRNQISHHPDLAGLQHDSRFRELLGQPK
jgi:tetratricopeptide (TPR) repeat protein